MKPTSKIIYYIIILLFLVILGILLYSTYKETLSFNTCELGYYPDIYGLNQNNYAPADAPFKYVYNLPSGTSAPIGTQKPTPTGTQKPTPTGTQNR